MSGDAIAYVFATIAHGHINAFSSIARPAPAVPSTFVSHGGLSDLVELFIDN